MDERVSKRITVDLRNVPENIFHLLEGKVLSVLEIAKQYDDATPKMLILDLDAVQEASNDHKN